MTRLIKRANPFDATSKSEMLDVCKKYAEENNCELVSLSKNWKWAYVAEFDKDGEIFGGVMIAVETGEKDWPFEADILFGPGQMVGSNGQHVIEEDEYYHELGIGE